MLALVNGGDATGWTCVASIIHSYYDAFSEISFLGGALVQRTSRAEQRTLPWVSSGRWVVVVVLVGGGSRSQVTRGEARFGRRAEERPAVKRLKNACDPTRAISHPSSLGGLLTVDTKEGAGIRAILSVV